MSLIPQEQVKEVGLRYVTDAMPGIERKRSGKGFSYRMPDGSRVGDAKTLARIRSLAIPPAYRKVWICPIPNGHLQATGLDAKGRKQYRYHPRFREWRDAAKYDRLLEFGAALPRLRERVSADMRRPGVGREKVLATLVDLLEHSRIRIGNDAYAKSNKSFGLTTLQNRHVKVDQADITFAFVGKSRIRHQITLHDRRIAKIVRKLQDLPGQDLFQYLDDAGEPHPVSSTDVNDYLRQITGGDFTAKDFRTWAATTRMLEQLMDLASQELSAKEQAAAIRDALKVVAHELGNTPSVCRKCYVHPAILATFERGDLAKPTESDIESTLLALLRGTEARTSHVA